MSGLFFLLCAHDSSNVIIYITVWDFAFRCNFLLPCLTCRRLIGSRMKEKEMQLRHVCTKFARSDSENLRGISKRRFPAGSTNNTRETTVSLGGGSKPQIFRRVKKRRTFERWNQ